MAKMAPDDEFTSSESGSGPTGDDSDNVSYTTPDGPVHEGFLEQLSDADTSGTSSPEPEPASPAIMASRAYQLEMLEESLKQNIIVAVRPSVTVMFCLANR
jgi:hypothetical protein